MSVELPERPGRDLRSYFCLRVVSLPAWCSECFGYVNFFWTVPGLNHNIDVSKETQIPVLPNLMTRNWPHSKKCQTAVSVFSFRISLQTEIKCATKREALGLCTLQRGKCSSLDTLVHKLHRDFFSLGGSQESCLLSSGKSLCHLLVLRELRVCLEYKNYFLQAGPSYQRGVCKAAEGICAKRTPALSSFEATTAISFQFITSAKTMSHNFANVILFFNSTGHE